MDKAPSKIKKPGYVPTFQTHAIYDEAAKDPESGITLTTRRGVVEARRFVEENKK